jgi:hypothetical protein
MSIHLTYSYTTNLTTKEKTDVDLKVKKNREEFLRGFRKGMKMSISIYSILTLLQSTIIAANASDIPLPSPPGNPVPMPGNPVPGYPVPVPMPGNLMPGNPVPVPVPVPGNPVPVGLVPILKPGMQPFSAATKGAFVGAGTAICSAALQTGDFALGFSCAMLVVIAGIVMNRPD